MHGLVVKGSPRGIPKGSKEVDDTVPMGDIEEESRGLKPKVSQGLRHKLNSGSPHRVQRPGLKVQGGMGFLVPGLSNEARR